MSDTKLDDIGDEAVSNDSGNPSLADAIAIRFGRRDLLLGALSAGLAGALPAGGAEAADDGKSTFDFHEIEAKVSASHEVSDGYEVQVLLRWGDPLFPDMPAFDPLALTPAEQTRRFGYNNDFVGYLPVDGSSRHGLLVVNHEYTNEELMFPGVPEQSSTGFEETTKRMVAVEMAAHGGSVVEIRREGELWAPVLGSRYTRRITAETPMELTGPAAGSPRLATSADPAGRRVLGMINNCSGGVTPWGTWLSGEENIHYYFEGRVPPEHREFANHRRYGLPMPVFAWHRHHTRFVVPKEPHEPNRFGWVVEIDPFDPTSTPKKRTALGRMKHEGAAGALTADGRYVVFLGDDERFEYVYRFVTSQKVDRANPAANRDILDVGTLSVARYDADGTGRWLPLVHGTGPLTEQNGFASQADVLIETRRAADLLGATKMDRPEDIEANPKTGRVYVMLTNNSQRKPEQVGGPHPRAKNEHGHVVELIPPGVQTTLTPGQENRPGYMPLEDYADAVFAQFQQQPTPREILVDQSRFLRDAEREGRYDDTFRKLNEQARAARAA